MFWWKPNTACQHNSSTVMEGRCLGLFCNNRTLVPFRHWVNHELKAWLKMVHATGEWLIILTSSDNAWNSEFYVNEEKKNPRIAVKHLESNPTKTALGNIWIILKPKLTDFIESTTVLLVMCIVPLTGLLYNNFHNIICAACYSTIASQPNIWKYCWASNTHNRKSPEPYPIYREKLCLPIFPYKNILNSLLIVSNFFCMTALSF